MAPVLSEPSAFTHDFIAFAGRSGLAAAASHGRGRVRNGRLDPCGAGAGQHDRRSHSLPRPSRNASPLMIVDAVFAQQHKGRVDRLAQAGFVPEGKPVVRGMNIGPMVLTSPAPVRAAINCSKGRYGPRRPCTCPYGLFPAGDRRERPVEAPLACTPTRNGLGLAEVSPGSAGGRGWLPRSATRATAGSRARRNSARRLPRRLPRSGPRSRGFQRRRLSSRRPGDSPSDG